MIHIDVESIRSNPGKRLDFLALFVEFTDDDWNALKESMEVLGPKLPKILDDLYDHLLSFDDTRRVFLGSRGELDPAYVAIRKEHLTDWILKSVSVTDRDAFAGYLVSVGRRHTGVSGEPERVVPPRYMVVLTSYIQTAFFSALFDALPNDSTRVRRFGLAWNKMLMIQLEIFLKVLAPIWPFWDEA